MYGNFLDPAMIYILYTPYYQDCLYLFNVQDDRAALWATPMSAQRPYLDVP